VWRIKVEVKVKRVPNSWP